MSEYTSLIYPEVENDYPSKLCGYIYDRFFSEYDGSLLDIGCSKGTHFHEFEKQGLQCWGVDLRKDIDNDRCKTCNIEMERFPFDDNMFQAVWSKSVIEHITSPDHMLNEAQRLLQPNGIIVLMTPDWESQMSHFWDDYTHVKAWTQKSLMNCLKMFGFRNVGCEKIYQLPFTWAYPQLSFIPKIVSFCPQSWKWKDKTMTNGKDRKLIRFSKEKMLLAWGYK